MIYAKLRWAQNAEDPEADRTVVTLQSPSHPFSFAADEVANGDRIYVKDFGALVTEERDPVGSIAEYARVLAGSGAKSVYARVKEHPEQTLKNAWNDMPIKRQYPFTLGLEGARQRFKIQPDGAIWMNHPSYAPKHPGSEVGRLMWPDPVTYRFGFPEGRFADRTIAEGYMPIITTRLDDGLLYEEEAFATTASGELSPSQALAADEPMVTLMQIRIVNSTAQPHTAHLHFSTGNQLRDAQEITPFETLKLEGDRVIGTFEGHDVVRFLLETKNGAARPGVAEGSTGRWTCNLHKLTNCSSASRSSPPQANPT